MRRFEGKVALVTAAAQGIGQAVVRRVAAEGGAVVVTDLREDAAAALAEEVGAELALGVKVDVTSRGDVDAAVAAAVGRFGRLDLLVNNAGGCIVTSVPEDTSAEDWHRQLDFTLVGAARCIQAAIPHLVKTRGNVVTISSVNGIAAFGNVEYAAAKAGQIAMSQNYAARYGPLGVRFNVVAPAPSGHRIGTPSRTRWRGSNRCTHSAASASQRTSPQRSRSSAPTTPRGSPDTPCP
ncbi:hypothetical protein Pflav_017020 [Phytohabitans flavus]|uniref:3-oxoacyl-ACP reductase n=1 Tax=Phytohabitans flavus TaxID=1076124 RepID=A0A6F8XN80_9ACTN|nr:SDR family NAD(P)-dependent oxidoreductase [Phytohabitans flavus]BCB75292.1 hypothetical protein Pflav_017020 [Phytohabitans flavus]